MDSAAKIARISVVDEKVKNLLEDPVTDSNDLENFVNDFIFKFDFERYFNIRPEQKTVDAMDKSSEN